MTLKKYIPSGIKQSIKKMKNNILYRGNKRFCPICNKTSSHFTETGLVVRKDAKCPHCGSLERHRLSWLFLTNKIDFFNKNSKKMLHVAPESTFKLKLKKYLGDRYIASSFSGLNATVQMDITDIKYDDETFDVIYCSHVLEHIQNDKQAMQELFRVLKSSGWAILLVPIDGEKTYEDFSIIDPEERLKHFGKEDHVRCYGRDYIERLRSVGFKVKLFKVSDIVDKDEEIKMGLTPASGDIYYCTK
jgi:SAM-dependent methyltransferase